MPRLLRRRPRRRRAPPAAVVRTDGAGHLIGLELEARLFGRIRLLTVEATAAVSDGGALVLDVTPDSPPVPTIEARPLRTPRSVPTSDRANRASLAEATALVRDARALLPSAGAARR